MKYLSLAVLMVVCTLSFQVDAASVNSSTSFIHSTGHANTYTTGNASSFEQAYGVRKIETDTSGRKSWYTRTSAETTTYSADTHSSTHEHAIAVNGTRIGESHGMSQTRSHTDGTAYTVGSSSESGVFVSWDNVDDSYSYEYGYYNNNDNYTAYQNSHSLTKVKTYSQSAYDIY